MRSKAPLVMMEQVIMVLIFALAAALCLQTFVLAGKMSDRLEAENRAVVEAQNAAETLKAGGLSKYMEEYGANQKENSYVVLFDENWGIVREEEQAEYFITLSFEETENPYVWRANIVVAVIGGEELFSLPVAGQAEVMQNE